MTAMLTAIELENFKCFGSQKIPLGPLTLLTGLNGMGKSSVMQSLLSLRQTQYEMLATVGLRLNGDLVRLGTAGAVLFRGATRDEIQITVTSERERAGW